MSFKFWTHNCKEVGMTATLHGELCNYCDVTEEDIMIAELNTPHDILEDPNGRSD